MFDSVGRLPQSHNGIADSAKGDEKNFGQYARELEREVTNFYQSQPASVEEAAEGPSGLIRESVMFFFRSTKTPRDFPIL